MLEHWLEDYFGVRPFGGNLALSNSEMPLGRPSISRGQLGDMDIWQLWLELIVNNEFLSSFVHELSPTKIY